jgi:hypothetical protein
MDIETLLKTIEERGEAFAASIERLSQAEFAAREGDNWSPREIAAHVAEFPLTFAAEAVRLATSLGITVGRNLDDAGRLEALHRFDRQSPAEAAAAIRNAIAEASSALRRLASDQWEAAGTRKATGEPITVRGIVEQLILDHLTAHLRQARGASPGPAGAPGS